MRSSFRAALPAVLFSLLGAGCSSEGPSGDAPPTESSRPAPSATSSAAVDDWAGAQAWVPGAVEPPHEKTFEVRSPWETGPRHLILGVWDRTDRSKLWDSTERPRRAGEPTVRIRGLDNVADVGAQGQVHLQATDGCNGTIISARVRREDGDLLRVLEVHRSGGWAADCAGPYSGLDGAWLDEALLWAAEYHEPSGFGDTWLLSDSVGNPLLEFELRTSASP